MSICPTCLRQRATAEDEATYVSHGRGERLPPGWPDADGIHLCWAEFGGDCKPPEWWHEVTPLDVQRLRAQLSDSEASAAAMRAGAKWFVYCPETGFDEFDTEAEAKKAAEESLDWLREVSGDGWHEDTGHLRYGMMITVEQAEEVDREETPGSEFDYTCNYILQPIATGRALRGCVAELDVVGEPREGRFVGHAYTERVEAERDAARADAEEAKRALMATEAERDAARVERDAAVCARGEDDAIRTLVETVDALRARVAELEGSHQ